MNTKGLETKEQSVPSVPDFVDSRRSVATPADNSKQVLSQSKWPKSFEVDTSKLTPVSFWESYGYNIEDQNTDVGEIKSSAPLVALVSDQLPKHLSQVSIRDLIDRYISDLSGHLSYFSEKAQVCLVYGGKKHSDPKTMLDWGSNVSLVDDLWCKEMGIPVIPTSLRLATSNAASTKLIGITPVLTVSYGAPPCEFCTQHAFLVVPHVSNGPFRILIGNGDAMKHGGIQGLGANTVSYRTKWNTMGLKSPVVSFPLLACRP